jgi:hypothetical protein
MCWVWRFGARLHGGGREAPAAAAAEFGVVDLVTQHHVKTDQQATGQRDLGFGPPAPPEHDEIGAFEIGIRPGREWGGLAEYPAKHSAALLTDVPQAALISRIDDGIWDVYFGPLKLGRLHERRMRIEDEYGRLYRHRHV